MQTKIADSRGRINLGTDFANKTFFFEKTGETEMKLKPAVMPEREIWLHRNPETRDAVLEATRRLKQGQFARCAPDVDQDEPWMEELKD
ncbi:MAG: hypothetical protein V1897_00130 [Pseudomonadota bacterium]